MAKDQHEPMTWYIDYQCDNVYCGHTYRVRLKMDDARDCQVDRAQPTTARNARAVVLSG